MGVGGLIHGEHFIVDSYILNGMHSTLHTQADMIITSVPLPTVLVEHHILTVIAEIILTK